jgi:hypothetical protein
MDAPFRINGENVVGSRQDSWAIVDLTDDEVDLVVWDILCQQSKILKEQNERRRKRLREKYGIKET